MPAGAAVLGAAGGQDEQPGAAGAATGPSRAVGLGAVKWAFKVALNTYHEGLTGAMEALSTSAVVRGVMLRISEALFLL